MTGELNQPIFDRLLAGRSSAGQHVEVIRDPDGTVSILFDGVRSTGCRWPADQTEQCVSVFLALLRAHSLVPGT